MHYIYIIYSKKLNRYYVGETPDVRVRLEQHNSHYFEKSFTKGAEDWKLALSKQYKSREDACYLERFIKRMKSRKFIEKVIAEPSILEEILSKQ